MARRKRRKKSSHSHDVLMILMGSALTLCVLSVMYGFLIRKSVAREELGEFRIEILNGTSERGLAARAAVSAREMNIDVFDVDNALEDHDECILIARRSVDDIGVLARALGCRNVIEQFREDSLVDATLIIGADYRSLRLKLDSTSGLNR
jgi:hypothetical protein